MYSGYGSAWGVGVEGTWGTAVSRANWYRKTVGGGSLKRQRNITPRNLLWGSATEPPMPQSDYVESELVTGRMVTEMHYNQSGMLLEACMGAKSTSGPSGSYYTHDFTLDPDNTTSLTIEEVRGNSGDSEVFEGVMVPSFSLSTAANGGPMLLSMDLIGQTSAARGSAGTVTYSSNDRPCLFHQAGTLTWNSVAYTVRSYRCDVRNALAIRPALGSVEGLQPTRSGIMEVTTTVTLEAASALYAGQLAETQSDYTFNHTGSGSHACNITGHNCKVVSADDPVDVAGVVLQTLVLRHYSDGTDFGLKVALVNLNSNARSQA